MMKIRISTFALLCLSAFSACGDDGSPGDSSVTVDSAAGDSASGDSASGDSASGDGATSDGGGDAAAGCISGGCPSGQMCCTGVPYPAEGQCAEMCNLRCDRNAKENFETIDEDAILTALTSLPISEWSYRDEGGDVRHVGPMAQDFHQRFGVGADDRVIHPVDATGVTIAAIQALTRRVDALERDNAALREHALSLEEQIRGR